MLDPFQCKNETRPCQSILLVHAEPANAFSENEKIKRPIVAKLKKNISRSLAIPGALAVPVSGRSLGFVL
jgi:hypothetical protein